jgi:hypothetical protein
MREIGSSSRKRPREDSRDQHDRGKSQRSNESDASKRPIRDFDAYQRQLYEQQQLAMAANKKEQKKIMKIISKMTTPDGNKKVEEDKKSLKEWSQSGGVSGEAYKKDYETIVKAQQEYNKRAEKLRKNYR